MHATSMLASALCWTRYVLGMPSNLQMSRSVSGLMSVGPAGALVGLFFCRMVFVSGDGSLIRGTEP